ncbi:MAG: cupin domain-containing protein [Pseudomonadota bacterium]
MSSQKVTLSEKFDQINDHWQPRLAGRVNETDVRLVKIKGDFDWHSHTNEDEMFVVIKGEMRMAFRDRVEIIKAGEFIIVPRGTEHRPGADEECEIMLIEPSSVVNTGDGDATARTVTDMETI